MWSPPSTTPSTVQATHPAAPTIRGRAWSISHRTPWNLPSPFLVANLSAASCWSLASMFTPNLRDSVTSSRVSEPRSSETRTIGGSIDSERKALTVVPAGDPPFIEVTTATGVATCAITFLNVSCSEPIGSVL